MLAPRASVAVPCSGFAEASDIVKLGGPPTSSASSPALRTKPAAFYAGDLPPVNVVSARRFPSGIASLRPAPSGRALAPPVVEKRKAEPQTERPQQTIDCRMRRGMAGVDRPLHVWARDADLRGEFLDPGGSNHLGQRRLQRDP